MRNTLLRMERLRHGWTQQQLADFAGISLSTVERAESGGFLRADSIQRLCDCLSKSSEELGLLRVKEEEIKIPRTSIEPEVLSPTRFLSLNTEDLIKRYEGEKNHLLELKTKQAQWTLPEVVIFDNTKIRLPMSAILVQENKSRPEYIIPDTLSGKSKDVLKDLEHHFYDSTTIRLTGIQNNNNTLMLTVAKAHYLQYIGTNYAMDALLSKKGWTRSLRDTVHPTNRLCKLEESLLANHIGVNTLVFTADNYLVLPIRSKANLATWPETLSPSISGATCYDDDMYHKKEGPVASWIREGREELGLDYSDFIEGNDVFLGITRDLLLGGKPGMFFITQVGVTKEKIEQKFKKARDKWENTELQWLEFINPLRPPTTEQERTIFTREFSTLLSLYPGQLSRPVQVAFALWFKYMINS